MNMRFEAPAALAEGVRMAPLDLTAAMRKIGITEGIVTTWGRLTTVLLKDVDGFVVSGGNAPWPDVEALPEVSLEKAIDAALWRLKQVRDSHQSRRRRAGPS